MTTLLRARTALYWCSPAGLGLLLYWPGLRAWFQKDDFAWLGLHDAVRTWHDLGWALFAPMAEGTIRTLSERVFWISFYHLFGMNALPYECWRFLVFAAAAAMLAAVCAKITGSRAAGWLAAVLWTVNNSLVTALSWTAGYTHALLALVLLAAIWFLARYGETGSRRFYVAQWIVFLLGFGVLELNVVYPALALAYALCCAPRIAWKIAPMLAVSALFAFVHFKAAPPLTSGIYKLHCDSSILATLATYWKMVLGPGRLWIVGMPASLFRSSLAVVLSAGLLGFLIWQIRRRQWAALFFAACFLIVLSPLLLLRDQINSLYLTAPSAGLAMWAAWGLVQGWRSGAAIRVAAAAWVLIYCAVNLPVARSEASAIHEGSQRKRAVLEAVVNASRAHPDKLILLRGVDSDLFWSAIRDHPFVPYRVSNVYMVPEEFDRLAEPRLPNPRVYLADPAEVAAAQREGRALVLDVSRVPIHLD